MADRRNQHRCLLALLALSTGLLPGCASLAPKTDPGRATALMQDVGARRSAVEIRERTDTLVPPLVAFVEDTADQIRAEASDPAVRRQALQLKIDLVPVILRAGFQPDPVAAALDLWLLSYQLEDCFDAGTGPCDFGPQQEIAKAAAGNLRETFDRLFEEVTINPSALERERTLVRDTASRYPLQHQESIRRRRTITEELTKVMDVGGLTPFEVLGDVSTTIASLSRRLTIYVDETARLARWHAELLAEDVVTWPTIDRALGDVDRMSASVDRVANTLSPEFLTGLVDRPLDVVREERQAAMDDVDHQRVLTLQYVSKEREALVENLIASLMTGIDEQRVAALADLRSERLETLDEIERLRLALITDSFDESRRLVDHVAWRLAQLLTGVLVLGAALVWALRRYPRKRPGE
jgi:hypothetical protein